jgi:hypothetical protein
MICRAALKSVKGTERALTPSKRAKIAAQFGAWNKRWRATEDGKVIELLPLAVGWRVASEEFAPHRFQIRRRCRLQIWLGDLDSNQD